MKFGQLIEYNYRIFFFFFKNHAENEAGRLIIYEVEASSLQLSFNVFR